MIGGSTNIIITNNNFSNLAGSGVYLSSVNTVNISGNYFVNCGDSSYAGGIEIYRCDNLWVENNNFSYSRYGLSLRGTATGPDYCTNLTLRNNEIWNVDIIGIYLVEYGEYCNISYNTIIGSSSHGIHISNMQNNHRLENNNISAGSGTGMYITSGSHEIYNNTLWGNTNNAIWLNGAGSGNMVINNTIYTTATGILLFGSSSSHIEYNKVYGAASYGIYLESGISNAIIGNNTLDGPSYGIYMSVTGGGNIIYNHNFTDCSDYGLYVTEGTPNVNWFIFEYSLVENSPCRLEGVLSIFSSGEMHWINSDLTLSPSSNGANYIDVNPGNAELYISDGCVFDSDTNYNYDFWVDGYLRVENSTISQAGYSGGGSRGIYLTTDGNFFWNATIQNGGSHGIFGTGADNTHIFYSNITNCAEFALLVDGSNNTYLGNNITNCAYGICVGGYDIWVLDLSLIHI